jgi:hypothetical protein
MARIIPSFIIFSVFAAGALHAQDAGRVTGVSDAANRQRELTATPGKEKKPATIPSLYEGEVDDVGPQLLLLEAPPHDWFLAVADAQTYYTSNATLSETATWSDVTVLTAQAGINARPFSVGSGKVAVSGGYRYQNFLYGIASARTNHDIAAGAGKIDSLDFSTHTGFLNAEWTQGGWSAGTGLRYSTYISDSNDKTTYQEWSPSVHGGYRFTLSERDFLSVDADADYRRSHTHLPSPFGDILGYDMNDRYDLGMNIAYTHIFGEHILVQPAYRFQFSNYTEGGSTASVGAGREDYYHTFSLTVGYYFNGHFSMRLFGSAEFRDSSEATIADYSNYNAGIGAMASITF